MSDTRTASVPNLGVRLLVAKGRIDELESLVVRSHALLADVLKQAAGRVALDIAELNDVMAQAEQIIGRRREAANG